MFKRLFARKGYLVRPKIDLQLFHSRYQSTEIALKNENLMIKATGKILDGGAKTRDYQWQLGLGASYGYEISGNFSRETLVTTTLKFAIY